MPKQKHRKPHRKVWVGAVAALLTLAASLFSGVEFSAAQVSTISTGVGTLCAYLVPAAEKDFESR